MITPRQYQLDAVAAVWRFFERGYGNPVVVAPTGSGKSVIIALLMREAVTNWPGTRVVCLADVKELMEQNAAAYRRLLEQGSLNREDSTGKDFCGGGAAEPPNLPVQSSLFSNPCSYGLYGASLGSRDTSAQVTFAQIQSCYAKAEVFGYVHFIVVDECHMINPKEMGMYREFIAGLKKVNPGLLTVGFTATPYRLGHGYVFKGKDTLFNGVAYDIQLPRLIADGHLVPPVARSGACHADTEAIEVGSNGEFKEESATREFEKITTAAVADMVARLPDRHGILVFACSIEHAEEVVRELKAQAEGRVELVTGATPKAERERIIADIRSGECRWLVNVGVLTKGFDAPNIDVVVLLRATQSAALYVQMIGRGLRPHPGKVNCVVLDYGENVLRHGPIDAVKPRQKGEKRDPKRVLAKECVKCGVYIAIGCRECPHCQAPQPERETGPSHGTKPGEAALLSGTGSDEQGRLNREEWYDVKGMKVSAHKLGVVGCKPSLRVEYQIGVASWASEFICPEHPGFPRTKAEKWMNERGYNLLTVAEAATKQWPQPRRVKLRMGGKWPEVLDYEFGFDFLAGGDR